MGLQVKNAFKFDENTLQEINEFDINAVRQKILNMESLESRVDYINNLLEKVSECIYEISVDIEDFFSDENSNDEETQRSLSVANYKQLILRNARYALMEELIIWKNEIINTLKKEIEALKLKQL